MKKCHICDNQKVEELETVKLPDGVLEAYYCKPGCGCRVDAQHRVHLTRLSLRQNHRVLQNRRASNAKPLGGSRSTA